jgi:membrane-anchored protein YejM (alkaline phosphatase superfamily)
MKDRIFFLRAGAWFFLMATVPVIIVSFRFLSFAPPPSSFLAVLYLAALTIGHFTTLTLIPYIALYVPAALICPKRPFLNALTVFLFASMLFVLVIDTFVFALYRFHINGFVLGMLFGGAASEVFEFSSQIYLFVLGIFIALAGLGSLLLYLFWKYDLPGKLKHGVTVGVIILALLVSSQVAHGFADAFFYRPITQLSRVYPLFYPLQFKKFLYKHGWLDPSKKDERIIEVLAEEHRGLNYPIHPLRYSADKQKMPNILWIIIDSWNYRAMGDSVTPNIAAFARESATRYANHSSGSNGTRGGIFTLFYGLPALYWSAVGSNQVGPLLLDEIIKIGYQFKIFTSASLHNPPFDRNVFINIRDLRVSTEGEKCYQRDQQITQDWLAFLDRRTEGAPPFFGVLFYDSPHAFALPPGHQKYFKPAWTHARYHALATLTDEKAFWNLYRNCVRFNDSLAGIVLDDLKAQGLLESTIVMFTGDHGQEFNENKKGFWGHNGNFSRAQTGVPLILAWPGRPPGVDSAWTYHFDIVPTFLKDAFGCTNPVSDYTIGHSLFSGIRRTWCITGSYENFAILEHDRITTIGYDGTYDITSPTLDPLPEATLSTKLIHDAMLKVNAYYLR